MLIIKLFGIYIVMKIFVPIPFFSLLVSYDMGIWNKKTTLIKINNNEKGFIQVKETIQASHQQWNIKKITIFFRSGKSWFGLVNHLGSPDRMSCKFLYNFTFTDRRPSIDASYQVSVHLPKRFRRRRFLKIGQSFCFEETY